jgi:hypothetical protein
MFQRQTCAFFALIFALATAPVLAQQDQHHPGNAAGPAATSTRGMAQGMTGGMPMMDMMRMMMGQGGMDHMTMMATAMSEHVEGRLAFLKTELKITDAQLPLWSNFAQAVRDNAKAMRSMMQGGMIGMNQLVTLPDELAIRERVMTAHLEALRKLKTAVDPLYAAFTDGQKKAADQLMLSPMGIM